MNTTNSHIAKACDQAGETCSLTSPAPETRVAATAPAQASELEHRYSIDEETFNYDCESEALQRLDDEGELVVGATIYQGEAHRKAPSYYFEVDSMLESMGERAYDDAGEWAADFPDMTKEKKVELRSLIGAWLDANVTATFYTVRNVQKVEVTAEMIADFNAPAALSAHPVAAPSAWAPDWPHVANEWADMATNAVQHIRNIGEGITKPEAALANLDDCLKHCRDVQTRVESATPPAAAPAKQEVEAPDLVARGMRWEECEQHMRQACAQAGVQWDDEKEPQGIAINVMQRLANAAHKTGFRLALERVGSTPAPEAPAVAASASDAAADVLAERRRQITAEGWTPEHDDEHSDGAMSVAAACYALVDRKGLQVSDLSIERLWRWTGWADTWFKPKTRRNNLVRAGALIVAEIERIDRAALTQGVKQEGPSNG